ncbi:hypothetical protein SEA_GREKAYCON_47 [Arthrobacter phage Grekaycon]|nr:hypothetical protein TAEYOUNG_48 [Arthrobacter phage TaeYoung]KUR65821.1 hypothetical protein JM67_03465 [Arthrobacter sp. ATCC 21022]QDH48537.1 hypothetical protein SEA_GREKAYCON_47 [Arthrobacter phage Grekaycon]QED11786.1 hypothetical protein SEA_BOSSLADY_48 [Arthrobacter phage BossLady]
MTEHIRFEDDEGDIFVVSSSSGIVTISSDRDDADSEYDEVNIYAKDADKLITGLQRALMHAAQTGEYDNKHVSSQCADLSGVSAKLQGSEIFEERERCEGDKHVIPHRGCILR